MGGGVETCAEEAEEAALPCITPARAEAGPGGGETGLVSVTEG